jgi:hypothetical protein
MEPTHVQRVPESFLQDYTAEKRKIRLVETIEK